MDGSQFAVDRDFLTILAVRGEIARDLEYMRIQARPDGDALILTSSRVSFSLGTRGANRFRVRANLNYRKNPHFRASASGSRRCNKSDGYSRAMHNLRGAYLHLTGAYHRRFLRRALRGSFYREYISVARKEEINSQAARRRNPPPKGALRTAVAAAALVARQRG